MLTMAALTDRKSAQVNKTDITTLGFLLHDAARLMRKRFEERASALGMSSAQWRLMARVVKMEGAPQARLAALLEIEPISVSRLLDRMEEGGWIERRNDETDRRVRMVFPTEKAREAYSKIKAKAGEVYEEALAGLAPGARQAVMDGLQTMVTNLAENEKPSAIEERMLKVASR